MKYRFINTNDGSTPWSLIKNPGNGVDSGTIGVYRSLAEAKEYLSVYLRLLEDNSNGEA